MTKHKKNFIAFINILWVSTVFSTPYLFLNTAARLQWPVNQISRSQQFPKAINSLITQSACVYLDLLPHVKRMLTEIYAGNQYFIQ
jgi:hypothetical protein